MDFSEFDSELWDKYPKMRYQMISEIELLYEEKNTYIVIGETDGMYGDKINAITIITVDDEMRQARLEKVIYLSESGRDMIEDDIIDANDDTLWDYMYSY